MITKNNRSFKRELLPSPIDYYRRFFEKLNPGKKYSSVKCLFHNDRNPSLSLNLTTGSFRCFGCGVTGGDIIDFQRIKYNLDFVEAVKELGAWIA